MTPQANTYESTTTYASFAKRIAEANSIVVTTHRKPDGNALGSVIGLYWGLQSIGKNVEILIIGPLEHGLKLAAGAAPIRILEDDGLPEGDPDLVIVVDTGACGCWLADGSKHGIRDTVGGVWGSRRIYHLRLLYKMSFLRPGKDILDLLFRAVDRVDRAWTVICKSAPL